MLEILRHFSFDTFWCDWILVLISTMSTHVWMNGAWGTQIGHARGLRQGDPLLEMLFLLVKEALNALIRKAETWSLLQPLRVNDRPHRTEVYVDDMILLIYPSAPNLHLACCIFSLFEGASGFGCNIVKFQMVPIRCDEDEKQLAISLFPYQVVDFPLTYLYALVSWQAPKLSYATHGRQDGG
jgi:hypothetical protein